MRHLIVAPQWLGDAVAAQALLQSIRALDAQAAVTVLALPSVAELVQAMPEVDEVLTVDFRHRALQWRLRRAWGRKLRGRFDVAWVLPGSLKAALLPWWARVPQRIGYRGEARSLLLTQAVARPTRHGAQRPLMTHFYLRLVEAWRVNAMVSSKTGAAPATPTESTQPTQPTPKLVLRNAQGAPASLEERAQLRQQCLAKDVDAAGYVAFCPGAEYGEAKRWPAAHYAALAVQVQRELGLRVVLLGAPRDHAMGQAIQTVVSQHASVAADQSQAVAPLNLCGSTSLTQAMALLEGAQAVVSNDSGLMHIAAALHRPTVGLFGSTDPRHTPPAGLTHAPHVRCLWLRLACSPCFQRQCPLPQPQHMACLRDLGVAQVWQALCELLPTVTTATTTTATTTANAVVKPA